MSTTRVGKLLHDCRQVICTLRVLVLAGLVMIATSSPVPVPSLYWFAVTVYAVTILGYLWARTQDFEVRRVKFLVFLFDVGMVSMLIVLRGESVSLFLAAYFGVVLMAAMMEGIGNAIVNAVLVGTLYAAITHWGEPLHALLDPGMASQFVFFFLIALFMGNLAEEARSEAVERRRAQAALASKVSELKKSTAELKSARDSLRANDRLATIGMLSAGIAHEIRSPLTVITSSMEPLRSLIDEVFGEEGGRDDELRRELDEIVDDCETACTHLLRVARDLTAMVREEAARPVPVDPRETLQTAVRMLRPRLANGMDLETEVRSTRHLLADPGRLLQVLLNLATNALDAMEETGGGTVRLEALDVGEDGVAFLVSDEGPGIPPAVQERLFRPFFTTKAPGRGTGLGLHVVSEIVKAYQGTITFDTTPGKGTCFRVGFRAAHPLLAQEKRNERAPQEPADRGRRGHDPQGASAHVAAGAV